VTNFFDPAPIGIPASSVSAFDRILLTNSLDTDFRSPPFNINLTVLLAAKLPKNWKSSGTILSTINDSRKFSAAILLHFSKIFPTAVLPDFDDKRLFNASMQTLLEKSETAFFM